jgi:hypothetical protein
MVQAVEGGVGGDLSSMSCSSYKWKGRTLFTDWYNSPVGIRGWEMRIQRYLRREIMQYNPLRVKEGLSIPSAHLIQY